MNGICRIDRIIRFWVLDFGLGIEILFLIPFYLFPSFVDKRKIMNNETRMQYRAVREAAGYFRREDHGWIAVYGLDRLTWLQGMVSADTRLMALGTATRLPACLLDSTGHLISDMALINVTGKEAFVLLDLPRRNQARVMALLDRYIIMEDVTLEDWSEKWGCVTLQGPDSLRIADSLRSLFPEANDALSGAIEVMADHTGSGGWDIFASASLLPALIASLEERGAIEIGAEAQDILRIEAGIPKYGADMDETNIALEAGLGPTHISMTKGCYIGQEIIARIDSRGHTNRALTGFTIASSELPSPGDKIYAITGDGAERETGRLTSVIAESPAMDGSAIALGYARHEHRQPETTLTARGENRKARLCVTELPFYPRKGGR